MKIFFHPTTFRHQPGLEYFNAEPQPHADSIARANSINRALRAWSEADFVVSKPVSLSSLQTIHTADYLAFLARIARHAQRIYPSVFHTGSLPRSVQARYPLQILAGDFVTDTYTPLHALAVEAAVASAGCARAAAAAVAAGERVAYAFCRPPGHHALSDRAGGYCYVNNAAVAAQTLAARGKKVAIVDFDYHHGNGTQDIFYTRRDVLFVSLHARPEKAFPHFSGFASEQGAGRGRDFTHNVPLPLGMRDAQYAAQLRRTLRRVRAFAPDYLVLSAGFDIHRSDPLGKFRLSDAAIRGIGREIAAMAVPTVIVQEGGYNPKTIGNLVRMFLEQW